MDARWKLATKVTRTTGSAQKEVLVEEVPHDFPRNAQGEVDW
jgi:hypothetical protein